MSRPMISIGAILALALISFAQANLDIPLGACTNFAVFAGTAITFGGEPATIATGSIGVSPGTSIGGNTILGTGSFERESTLSIACARDLNIAYDLAKAAIPTVTLSLSPSLLLPTADLAGLTLSPGVYSSAGSIIISAATATLDGHGDENAQFLFQAATSVITSPMASFILINGAQASNIYWLVGTAVTIGQSSSFVGTILAGTAIVFDTDTVLIGRALGHTAVTFAGLASVSLPVAHSITSILSISPKKTFSVSEIKNLRSREPIQSAITAINLGDCADVAVQAGSAVSFNNARTVIGRGSVGVSPGSSVSGSYQVKNGSIEINSLQANKCAADRIIAYNAAAAAICPTNQTVNELSQLILLPGVYCTAGGSMTISGGSVTLDAKGNQDAVWIFQVASSLITAPNTVVSLLNGAQAKNVFWNVGSSATLGYSSTFVGTILAYASIAVMKNTAVSGRVLAGAAVTFESNDFIALPAV